MYDAIRYYRKAVQLVPDIEFQTYHALEKKSPSNRGTSPTVYKSIKDVLPLSKNKCCISAASLIFRWSVLSPSLDRSLDLLADLRSGNTAFIFGQRKYLDRRNSN